MIDDIDRQILAILQKDGRTGNADIARQVGMAPSGTLERTRKLEDKGLINGIHARVNLDMLGYGLLAFISVRTTEGWSTRETARKLAEIPNVIECHDVAGDDCYLLKVRARNTRHLNVLLRKYLGAIPMVVSTRTTIVMETYKELPDLPIEEVHFE